MEKTLSSSPTASSSEITALIGPPAASKTRRSSGLGSSPTSPRDPPSSLPAQVSREASSGSISVPSRAKRTALVLARTFRKAGSSGVSVPLLGHAPLGSFKASLPFGRRRLSRQLGRGLHLRKLAVEILTKHPESSEDWGSEDATRDTPHGITTDGPHQHNQGMDFHTASD